jgi:hypothetical protein
MTTPSAIANAIEAHETRIVSAAARSMAGRYRPIDSRSVARAVL